ITGFRLAEGGAQEYYGVTPDLVTFGKILGGGFPIGAISGKREHMEKLAPQGDVYQAGTFNGNPISITAGLTTLKLLDKNFYTQLEKKGQYLRKGIGNILEEQDLDYKVAGLSSMFQIYFTGKDVYDYQDAKTADTDKFDKYFHKLLEKGVFIPPSQFECCFISLMHSEDDLEYTLAAVGEALKG
ncbi:MAG: aminotransferase class III-fold pyridoxal phosphate-dependent enzyme, partial [Methanobacterium sp.]